ncbi:MAG TPA: phage baseplate assembly protein V [Roseiflexaceae bacterium]|nr:phage baseplate assembly protein V [Roseiflexaceae bacterium]
MAPHNPSSEIFEPAYAHWQPGAVHGAYLARVVSVDDPERLARVQVRLLTVDNAEGQNAPVWARVAVPYAGPGRGAFFIPDVDDEVLVAFVNGDPRFPIVIGGLWNGSQTPPEQIGGDRVDRWTFVGKHGARVAVVEEREGQSLIELSTPGDVSATLKQDAGGSIEISAAGSTITIDSQGVTIQTTTLKVQASRVAVSAAQVQVDAALARFSGVVQCNVLQATTVSGATYTPGAGNIW